MKISGGMSEDGIVVGNTYDKYQSGNPIARRLMKGFENSLLDLVEIARPESIHEVGCGEGYWVMRWLEQGLAARGSDFSDKVIDLAKTNARERQLPEQVFKQQSIYDLNTGGDSADLIVCCEVMEHLQHPGDALKALQGLAARHVILSVPREPIWSVLNMARGKYWSDFGNTPGHIQRWSRTAFVQLVSGYFEIVDVREPFPWTMVLCRPCKQPA